MNKTIVITGGSGFVGSQLIKKFLAQNWSVIVLDLIAPREILPGVTFIKVDLLKESVPGVVSQADAVVHLMGVNIFNRWTEEYKKLIYDSRIETTKKLVDFFKTSEHKPDTFVCASAVGFYGDRGEEMLSESNGSGDGFLSRVCADWEAAAEQATTLGVRVVSVRTGIVLSKDGGMLGKLIPIFKLGIGGRMGTGRQWFSWIGMDDLLNVYELAVSDDRIRGPLNAVTPEPIRNSELVQDLGRALHRPVFIPLPSFLLRLIVGEFAGAIIGSQRVIPTKLQAINFIYKAKTIEEIIK